MNFGDGWQCYCWGSRHKIGPKVVGAETEVEIHTTTCCKMSFFQAMSQPKMGIAGAMPFTTYSAPNIQLPGFDHSKGQWFLPTEELPAGYVATTHPEGHATPLKDHAMSRRARETFALEPSFGTPTAEDEAKAKTSKKRRTKSSGCC